MACSLRRWHMSHSQNSCDLRQPAHCVNQMVPTISELDFAAQHWQLALLCPAVLIKPTSLYSTTFTLKGEEKRCYWNLNPSGTGGLCLKWMFRGSWHLIESTQNEKWKRRDFIQKHNTVQMLYKKAMGYLSWSGQGQLVTAHGFLLWVQTEWELMARAEV